MAAQQPVSMPDTVTIKATEVTAPPPWALLERRLISLMEQAAAQFMEKYVSPGGKLFFVHDVDDEYESIQNWGAFYAIGGDKQILEWGLQRWEACRTTAPQHDFWCKALDGRGLR